VAAIVGVVEGVDRGSVDDLPFQGEALFDLVKVREEIFAGELLEAEEAMGEHEGIRRALGHSARTAVASAPSHGDRRGRGRRPAACTGDQAPCGAGGLGVGVLAG
jgi:hypothetical protein